MLVLNVPHALNFKQNINKSDLNLFRFVWTKLIKFFGVIFCLNFTEFMLTLE